MPATKSKALPPGRRERDRRRHREDILDAALGVFTRRGFHGSTMQDIATASGFAVASIYSHFQSKEDIYHALVERAVGQYLDILQAALADVTSPLERLRAAARATVAAVREQREITEFILFELRGLTDGSDTRVRGQTARDVYHSVLVFYEVLFAEAQRVGEVAPHVRPIDAALVLIGGLLTNLLYWAHFGGDEWSFDPDNVLRIVLDRVASE